MKVRAGASTNFPTRPLRVIILDLNFAQPRENFPLFLIILHIRILTNTKSHHAMAGLDIKLPDFPLKNVNIECNAPLSSVNARVEKVNNIYGTRSPPVPRSPLLGGMFPQRPLFLFAALLAHILRVSLHISCALYNDCRQMVR